MTKARRSPDPPDSPTVEIIFAAYNRPDFVAATLEGYLAQLDSDFSIAIADDGSGPEVAALVGNAADRGLRIRHVWHEDQGFRRSRILNRAIGSSSADLIILTDADCIPSRRFVADHRSWASPGRFSSGRRVELGPRITADLLANRIPRQKLEDTAWLLSRDLRGHLDSARYAVRFPGWIACLWSARTGGGAMGANMSAWREDLVRVNGFDSEYEGWGGEDDDLVWRLEASGVTEQPIRGRAPVFHMYHEALDPSADNPARLEERKRTGEWRARKGIVDETAPVDA